MRIEDNLKNENAQDSIEKSSFSQDVKDGETQLREVDGRLNIYLKKILEQKTEKKKVQENASSALSPDEKREMARMFESQEVCFGENTN